MFLRKMTILLILNFTNHLTFIARFNSVKKRNINHSICLDIGKAEFLKLLELNIIRLSSSPWASPLHIVKKLDGSWRPCGDYRSLNNITIPDRYPIPNLQSFHHKLEGAVIFSKIDLVKAYHFIPVAPEDVEETAICTPFGSFKYIRMPFGLRNSACTIHDS